MRTFEPSMQRGFIQIVLFLVVVFGLALFGSIEYAAHIGAKTETDSLGLRDQTAPTNLPTITATTTHPDNEQVITKLIRKETNISSTTALVTKTKPIVLVASTTTPQIKPVEKVTLTSSSKIQFQLNGEAGELHAYDEQGRHTGLASDPGTGYPILQEDIPDSTYMLFGANVDLLFPPKSNGRVEVRGLKDGNTSLDVFYDDMNFSYPIALHKGSVATIPIVFSKSETGDRVDVGPLELDVNGDGKTKQIIHGIAF